MNSRIHGFYTHPIAERVRLLAEHVALDESACAWLASGGGLDLRVADTMSENVVAVCGLPLGLALNFTVNGRDHVVPMATEEPSVVAAASNAARMVRASGGFRATATRSMMIAQVQFDDVPDVAAACARVERAKPALMACGDAAIPRMVERGFGCRDVEPRCLDASIGVMVVHVHIDVGDAMGANTVDTVAEALAGPLHELVGGTVGLRILSNLCDRRRVRVEADVTDEAVGGAAMADGIARASRFAELDVYRAVTHNKGFMNGLDAAAVALGQDWRSLEAAAHAWAARSGTYGPLSVWRRTESGLRGEVDLPMAVGTVGGSTHAHPGVRAAFAVLGVDDARGLAMVMAAAGLASNLAALRALAGEGIQRGHMRLHARKHAEVDTCTK